MGRETQAVLGVRLGQTGSAPINRHRRIGQILMIGIGKVRQFSAEADSSSLPEHSVSTNPVDTEQTVERSNAEVLQLVQHLPTFVNFSMSKLNRLLLTTVLS